MRTYGQQRRICRTLREAARQLGISHTHLRRLIKKFKANPEAAERYERNLGPASFDELRQAKAQTEEWRAKGWLRPRPVPRTRIDRQIYERVRQARPYDPESEEFERRVREWIRDHPPKND